MGRVEALHGELRPILVRVLTMPSVIQYVDRVHDSQMVEATLHELVPPDLGRHHDSHHTLGDITGCSPNSSATAQASDVPRRITKPDYALSNLSAGQLQTALLLILVGSGSQGMNCWRCSHGPASSEPTHG